MRYPDRIHIREVSPRDGLQGEPVPVSTDDKVRFVDLLSSAGFPQINTAAFVSPRAVPQMADAEAVMARIARRPGVVYDASVPNLVGARRAIAAGADAISVFVGASDEANQRNVRRSTDESMADAEALVREARSQGVPVIGTIANAFGSPYGDDVPAERVVALAKRFVDAGATNLALGDTSGEANPRQVAGLVGDLLDRFPDVELSLHFHDTRGLGLANVLAAMDAGATCFDAAVGGIGGSPFTRDAAGNVSTEDLVNMCAGLGIETGVDLDVVLEAYRFLEQVLQHPLPGRLGQVSRRAAATSA